MVTRMPRHYRLITLLLAVFTLPLPAQEVTRFLVPVTTEGAGGYGSFWKIDLFAFNSSDRKIFIGGLRVADSGISPGRTMRLLVFDRPTPPPGQFVRILRDEAAEIEFALHVRDVMGVTTSWGTQIPVVAESDFRPELALINIPLTSAYRDHLRIYTTGETDTAVTMRIAPLGNDGDSDVDVVVEEFVIAAATIAGLPGYFEIRDLRARFPQLLGEERMRIALDAERPIWAFAAVTNNATNEVTIFAPN